jgi:glycosyltransferase involved in cell wall biosynthesis
MLKRVRIVQVTPAREPGGVLRAVLDLASGMQDRGHEVVVGITAEVAAVREATEARGLRWVEVDRAVRVPADVWHLHLHNSLETVALRLLARRRRVSGLRVLTEHLPRSFRTDPSIPLDPAAIRRRSKPGAYRAKTLFKRLEYALTDAVITPSAGASEFLRRRYHLKQGAATMIHNGVPVPADPAPPIPDEPMEVLLVGTLAHRKGQDVLLKAASRATERWNITFVGEGAARPSLEREATRLADRRIRFTGWRSDAANAPIDCHVACVPSRMESFSYVALEAMACGRPVVASTIDGLSEIVEDGVSGLLVAPDDPTALAHALDALAVDPDLRQSMGVAAHARASDRFDVETMITRTLDFYGLLRRV